jgi:16S rRNA processing protein RimM
MSDLICIGAIAGAFGISGEVRLKSFCSEPTDIANYGPLLTEDGGRTFHITLTRPVAGGLGARIQGVTTKEEADALRGTSLFVSRERLPSLPDDEFYHADLIGLDAYDTGGELIGRSLQSTITALGISSKYRPCVINRPCFCPLPWRSCPMSIWPRDASSSICRKRATDRCTTGVGAAKGVAHADTHAPGEGRRCPALHRAADCRPLRLWLGHGGALCRHLRGLAHGPAPRTVAGLARRMADAHAWLAALAQVLSQILLVAILFGIGRGLGGLADIGPLAIDPLMPLSLSFLAIPVCRMLWDPREAASQGYFLDDEAEFAHSETAAGSAAMAIIPLLNLPDTEPDASVGEAVADVLDVPAADLR